jgi:hypothetical protein
MRASTLGRVAVAFVVAVVARQLPAQIVNGGFETGDLSGWNVDVWPGSSGNVAAWDQLTSPLSGFVAVGPRSGRWYATTDQGGPGAYAISQQFTIAGPVQNAMLRFSLSTSNQYGANVVGPDFDPFNTYANQYASVDLLSGGVGGFTTTGVLQNFFQGGVGGLDPWHDYVVDITALLQTAGTYTLRFAETDNQFFYQMGVDDVSLDIVTTATPEPATLTLVAGGALLLGAVASRRRRR